MSAKVSVIVPIYNAEKYIEKTIESILNQSLKEIEIICIDDGSSDGSLKILRKYERNNENIKVISVDNGGPGRARNIGMTAAKGQYIGFVDSDDSIDKDMFKIMYELGIKDLAQMVLCAYREVNEKGIVVDEIHHYLEGEKTHNNDYIRNNIIKTFSENKNLGLFSLCNKIYLRDWLLGLGFLIDEKRPHGEDWWFNINVFLKLNKFICTDEALYNYNRVNSESLMAVYRENQMDLCLDGRKKLLSILPKELVNYEELNKNFTYEYYSYLVRTAKEVKDKNKKIRLIKKVICEDEVIECARNVNEVPVNLKILNILIRSGIKSLTLLFLNIRSVV